MTRPFLGRYVVLKWREDGSALVYFAVPPRLRPPGFPAMVALPTTGERRGNLADPREVTRIQADAERLHDELRSARALARMAA